MDDFCVFVCVCVCCVCVRACVRACVWVHVPSAHAWLYVCMYEKEKTTSRVLKFVLLFLFFSFFFFPLQGKYRHQRDQVSWCVFQPRGSQLCKECRMCMKSMHSLLNSHTTIVMYSTVHNVQYSGQMPFYSWNLLPPPTPQTHPHHLSLNVCSIATEQEHKITMSSVIIYNRVCVFVI